MNFDFLKADDRRYPEKAEKKDQNLKDRLSLLGELHGVEFTCTTECKKCGELSPYYVMKGFVFNDKNTTRCPGCGQAVSAFLTCRQGSVSEVFYFLKPDFVIAELGKPNGREAVLKKSNPALYYMAIIYFGTVKNALGEPDYEPSVSGWEEKVRPFFGILPDAEIAECVGVHPHVLRRVRRNYNLA